MCFIELLHDSQRQIKDCKILAYCFPSLVLVFSSLLLYSWSSAYIFCLSYSSFHISLVLLENQKSCVKESFPGLYLSKKSVSKNVLTWNQVWLPIFNNTCHLATLFWVYTFNARALPNCKRFFRCFLWNVPYSINILFLPIHTRKYWSAIFFCDNVIIGQQWTICNIGQPSI